MRIIIISILTLFFGFQIFSKASNFSEYEIKQTESQGKKRVIAIAKSQMGYYLEYGEFVDSIAKLNSILYDSNNASPENILLIQYYDFKIQKIGNNKLLVTATSKVDSPEFREFVSVVELTAIGFSRKICPLEQFLDNHNNLEQLTIEECESF